LQKPDVLGAIYRIRKSGAPRVEDPRGLSLEWNAAAPEQLIQRLGDARPAVRRRAVQQLGRQGAAAAPLLLGLLTKSPSALARRHAVWAAARIDGDAARAVARQALNDQDETVRHAALHSVGLRKDGAALPQLLQLLRSESPHNRRAAAEALGRLEDRTAVAALLSAAAAPADRALEHSLIYALIEISDPMATAEGLKSDNPNTQRAALTALDQMPGGTLVASDVAPLLAAADPALKQTAAWIVGHHPEWGGELAGYFRTRLAARLSTKDRAEIEDQLARLSAAAEIQALLASRLSDPAAAREEMLSVLRAISLAQPKAAPESWITALERALERDDREIVGAAVACIRNIGIAKKDAESLARPLLKTAAAQDAPDELRVAALAAVPGGLRQADSETFRFLIEQLDPERPVSIRLAAVEVLSKARLDRSQLEGLTESLEEVGPLEVDRLLAAFEQTTDEQVGLKLIAALSDSAALSALRSETLKQRLKNYGPVVQKQAEKLYAKLDVGLAEQKASLEKLLTDLPTGDHRRGQGVFNSTRPPVLPATPSATWAGVWGRI
jgi:hypothetical protein